MTTAQYDRQIDALVAEKLMGFEWRTLTAAWTNWEPVRFMVPPVPPGEEGLSEEWDKRHPLWDGTSPVTIAADWDRDLPHYSTSIADAFQVVQAIEKRGFWMELKSPFDSDSPWFAGFTPHSTTGWNGLADFVGSGNNPAHAICVAALAVIKS